MISKQKNKNMSHQVKNKYGISGSTTQQINQMSVYSNDLVQENENAWRMDNKRMPRGSNTGLVSELSKITQEHREMRTSSATAGHTETEYQLLNMSAGIGLANMNFRNQNHTFIVGGNNTALQGASKLSIMSGQQLAPNSINYGNKLGMPGKHKPQSVKSKKITKKNLGLTNGSNGPMPMNLPSSLLGSRIQD
jgi:hypothetical protein